MKIFTVSIMYMYIGQYYWFYGPVVP